jgi:myo-inositol 2-dehydrogenase/D-chiro-inositol 1-dehydrogenase
LNIVGIDLRVLQECHMTKETIRFGLIGFGLFGRHHARAIAGCQGAQLAAIAVKSEKSQAAARKDYPQAHVFDDYRKVVERDDIDVIDVVVPNQLHFETAAAALRHGKHVLLEKPMSVELLQCDELLALAKKHDRILAINHELRLSSLWGGVKKLILSGKIGRPLYTLIELSRFPYRQGAEGWRYDIQRVGNWILEEPIHFFDLARWYMSGCGNPISVYARANSRQQGHPELRDNFSAMINFKGEQYAVVSQTLAAFEHHVTAKVVGAAGTIWAYWSAPDARSDKPTFALRYGLGDSIHSVTFDQPTGELVELADQITAVVKAVREGTAPPCSGEDGRWSTLLCLAAQRSVDTGRITSVDELMTTS